MYIVVWTMVELYRFQLQTNLILYFSILSPVPICDNRGHIGTVGLDNNMCYSPSWEQNYHEIPECTSFFDK